MSVCVYSIQKGCSGNLDHRFRDFKIRCEKKNFKILMPLPHHISTLMMETESVPETFFRSTLSRLLTRENYSAHDHYEMFAVKQSRSVASWASRFSELVDDSVGRSV
jgi:hypothetical protein